MDQLVARFRELTGTTCTPASFTPPSQEDATVTGDMHSVERPLFRSLHCTRELKSRRGAHAHAGSSWQLLLNSGNCVLSRIAQQVRLRHAFFAVRGPPAADADAEHAAHTHVRLADAPGLCGALRAAPDLARHHTGELSEHCGSC